MFIFPLLQLNLIPLKKMSIIMIILILFPILCALAILHSTIKHGISPMPSSHKVQPVILRLLKKYNSGKIIYDLGSGWGNLVLAISNANPKYRIIGIEHSFVPYLFSQLFRLISGDKRSWFRYKDFFTVDLKDADIVVCYLCTDLMTKLKMKFEQELKEGTVVISSTFAVPGWEPIEIVTVDDWYRSKIYVYKR